MIVKVDTAASGATPLVAAPKSDKRYKVTGYHLVAAGAVTAKFVSGSTDLTGAMSMITGVPHTVPPGNALDTPAVLLCGYGEALNLTLGGAVQVSGWVAYETVG